jgi:putative DNA primase/helicase
VARFDVIKSGKPGKMILPLTYCGSTASGKAAWRWQALPAPRPLYNLDKLTAHPGAPVILAEGEKSADAAAILFPEPVATTTLNGAQSPHCTDFSPLKGCSVWIFPDHDVPGRKYGQDVAKLLRGVGLGRP